MTFLKNKVFWIVLAVLLAIGCIIGFGDDGDSKEAMPNVVGQRYDVASKTLNDYYDVKYVDKDGNATLGGVVTKQQPKAGTQVSHSDEITITLDPLGKTPEEKAKEALNKQAEDSKNQNASDVINNLESRKILGTVKTNKNVGIDQIDIIKNGIASGTAYVVTDANVNNGKIDLIVDTVAHHNRELASLQIPELCVKQGEQQYPYGFKQPMFSNSSGVSFSDPSNWTYSFEANITNAFGATAKKVPVTCTGTLTGDIIQVTGLN